MAQWINLLQNKSVLQMVSAFVVLKTGPIHLMLVGLTACRLSGQLSIRLSDERLVVLEIFEIPDVSLDFLNQFLALVRL